MLNVGSFTKKESVLELSNTMDSIYRSYQKEIEQLTMDDETKKKEYQQLLLAVDNIRTAYLIPYINQLYLELEEYGSPSKRPNYITFLTDQSIEKERMDTEIKRTYLLARKRLTKEQTDPKDLVTKFLYEWTKNKKKIDVGNQDIKNLRDRIALRKQEYRNEINKTSEMISKLNLYLNVLIFIKDSIKEIVLPEMEGVHAFLVAKNMAAQISVRQYPGTITLESILKLANTPYEKHYFFIKQVFLFYSNVIELMEHSINVDFSTKKCITPKDFSWLLGKKDMIEKSVKEMSQNIFYIQK